MLLRADHYSEMAKELHQRERSMGGQGLDPDRNGTSDRVAPDCLHHFA
ncbi:MAG: hypothetical protein ACLUD2_14465 [Clostridium sp.]